jgi:hypothetical protein
MTRTDVRAELRANLAITAVLRILVMSLGIGLVMDLGRRASHFHAFVAGAVILVAAVGVGLGARRLRTVLLEAQAPRPARPRVLLRPIIVVLLGPSGRRACASSDRRALT